MDDALMKYDNRPQPLAEPNYEKLRELCADLINEMAIGSYHPDQDWDQWIYEEALIAIYGKNIFEWINKNS